MQIPIWKSKIPKTEDRQYCRHYAGSIVLKDIGHKESVYR